MKKTIFLAVALIAMSLNSCDSTNSTNNNSDKQNANAEQVQTTPEAKAEAASDVAIPENMTGDMEKDAEALVKATLAMSTKMTTGKDNNADAKKVQQAMETAKEYYGKQGKTEEFVKIVNEKMTKGLAEMAMQMNTEKAH